jgi:uncharacterized SAM-binding protein YcdF (DUF218 family)
LVTYKNYSLKKITYILFLSILFSGCSVFRPGPTTLYNRALENAPYDVIIVPGVPFNGKSWSGTMKGRVLWAHYLIRNGVAKNVIFSGGAVYSPYVEAKIMALYAEALGISREHIFIEDKAEHSTENVYNSYQLAKRLGFQKIALASDPFQSNLLMRFTKRRFKMPIDHIPFMIPILAEIDDIDPPQIVADSAKVENFKSIVQTQSKWHRMRGTRGKNIKFEKE